MKNILEILKQIKKQLRYGIKLRKRILKIEVFPEFLDLVLNNTTGKKIIICEGKIGRKSGCGCLAGCCKCICAYENCKKKRDKHSRSFKERMYCSKHLRIIK